MKKTFWKKLAFVLSKVKLEDDAVGGIEPVLKPCPFCGGKPKLIRCGDQKEFFVYICSVCYRTPVQDCEARLTPRGAMKIWNRRVENAVDQY